MLADVDVAPVAALLGDPARARMAQALHDGRALPASELARRAGVRPSTASEHLARLVDGGLLAVERSGRHRYFRLSSPDVAHAIEALAVVAPPTRPRSLRQATVGEALAAARTCYDHLAGALGVTLADALLRRRAIEERDGVFTLGPAANDTLAALGIAALPPRRARFAAASTGASGGRTSRARSAPRSASVRSRPAGSSDCPARERCG